VELATAREREKDERRGDKRRKVKMQRKKHTSSIRIPLCLKQPLDHRSIGDDAMRSGRKSTS
jgi:hypothetical protein